jgi:hypothetical protein
VRIRDLPLPWRLYGLALLLFIAAMALPVGGHAMRGWNLAVSLEYMGSLSLGAVRWADSGSMLLSAGFLLAGLAGLGNAVFLLAPLAMWRRWSPRVFRCLLLVAGLGLLLMSVIALALLVMTEIRAAYLAWLAAYIPLIVSLGLHSGLIVDESEKTLEPDGK